MPNFLPDNASQTTPPQLRNENSTETTATCNEVSQSPSQTSTGTSSAGSTNIQNSTELSTPNPSDDGILTPTSHDIAGANKSTVPKYPKYTSKTVRVTSFNDCGDIVIPPDSLADSGFFYAGFGDCVRCFQCGVGLRHWSEEDDQWIEHSRWSKDCAFVRQMRSQEFVNLVQMAVQYSQNQTENEQTSEENTTGTNQEAPDSDDIENLMHTNAAQSVLEMGYDQNIIRRAIRAIRETNDHEDLTAISLMEKIFALEEADNSANSNEHMEPLQQSLTSQSSQARSELPTVGTNADNHTTRSQRPTEVNIPASSNAPMAQTAARDDMAFVSTHSGGPELTRARSHVDPSTDRSVRRTSGKLSTSVKKCDLIRENQRLRYQTYCINCRAVLRDVLFLSCPDPHLVLCHNCFMYFDRCPICNTTVKALINVER
ncbi:inhibitor of apoptosis protein-like [Mercenaria mercenaria]|uniref:inhibitor of apoptosis protein-like n=1 Tax=Mercenaria mercenaria TaxID=6596 RepID=UPI00234E8EA0|nr:inhibitor of apoptosis protein-like [Mercenaria mercenaria]XP_053391444.1 inhibitor of apoptosis protein-like [Mercenaria mercenaria]